jgi:hypothetical protein
MQSLRIVAVPTAGQQMLLCVHVQLQAVLPHAVPSQPTLAKETTRQLKFFSSLLTAIQIQCSEIPLKFLWGCGETTDFNRKLNKMFNGENSTLRSLTWNH